MLEPFKDILLAILNFFYSYVGNYGVSIILLTVVVRIILLPLTINQTKSMMAMQKFQPKLKEIQEKYKNDKEKMQKEVMKLYSENKINPLGGCLPLVLQLPVFFALFRMLMENEQLKGAYFLGISDLSKAAGSFSGQLPGAIGAALPYFVLIFLMVLTTYLPQKMMPSSDPQQAKTMNFMTLFLGVIAWNLPAGILLYWITTNTWQLGQQILQAKLQPKEE